MNSDKPLCLWEIEVAGLPTMKIEARSASQAKSFAALQAQNDHQMTRTTFERKLAVCRRLHVLADQSASL